MREFLEVLVSCKIQQYQAVVIEITIKSPNKFRMPAP